MRYTVEYIKIGEWCDFIDLLYLNLTSHIALEKIILSEKGQADQCLVYTFKYCWYIL